ncbi:MAG: rRNA maturation RNase YbeY [Prevotella sp.]|nr:rRNA maturation RNase YbeY [Candidatus Equicola stercoris]
MISYQCDDDVKMPVIAKRQTNKWIRDVAALHNKRVGDVAYIFCHDNKILEVNKQYLAHDYYTDIITFDYTENQIINGDIFISLDTVLSNSQLQGTDYNQELHRVIIHGILHLCGINDKGKGERAKMEQAENEALRLISLL